MNNNYHNYDGRSSVFVNGELRLCKDGSVDMRSSAVRGDQPSVMVRADGYLDGRSSAVRQENLRLAPRVTDVERKTMAYEVNRAWEKAPTIPGINPDLYRVDQLGNVMYKPSYGKFTDMGFNIDHSKPHSEGGTNHINNLNAMNSLTNSSYGARDHTSGGFGTRPVAPLGVDLRSSGIKSGETSFKPDGSLDGRSAAVRKGDVFTTQSGNIDGRSGAVRRGDIIFK